jgi:hypothetical protein
MSCQRRTLVALAGVVLLGLAGCHATHLPKTYPVSGKVVYQDGQPVTGGMVQFRPARHAGLTTVGEIQPDGHFALTTVYKSQRLDGAIEGKHEVTVMPAIQERQPVAWLGVVEHIYRVTPGENYFTIEVKRPRRPADRKAGR